jgi:hypothetical protein
MISPVEYENRFIQTGPSRLTLCPPNGVKVSSGVTADAGPADDVSGDELAAQYWREVNARVQAGAGIYNGCRDVTSRRRVACRPQSGLVPGLA